MWSTGGKRKDREKGKKKESDSDIKSNTLCTSPLASDGVTLSLLYEIKNKERFLSVTEKLINNPLENKRKSTLANNYFGLTIILKKTELALIVNVRDASVTITGIRQY
jgi:hypothetical protein